LTVDKSLSNIKGL